MNNRRGAAAGKAQGRETFLHKLWERARAKIRNPEGQPETGLEQERKTQEEEANALFTYWSAWRQASPGEEDEESSLEELYAAWVKETFDECSPEEYDWSEERLALEGELGKDARPLAKQLEASQGKAVIDALPLIKLSKDKMVAWVFVFAPLNGGKKLTNDMVSEALRNSGVTYGIEYGALMDLIESQSFMKLEVIAMGTLQGKDGRVIERFARESASGLQEDEHGVVDFKNLHMFQNVAPGEVICRIVKPVNNGDGVTVCDEPRRGQPGKPAAIPQGENTQVTPDGMALIATAGGHITFSNGQFHVQNVYVVEGDVDNETGNLEFYGDIVIKGDIRSGFSVKAKGDIVVEGMAEDAHVESEGSITIIKGMNGNDNGVLHALGDIKCRYLENCTVYAAGNIFADSIICCNVLCDSEVKALSGKGVIIGGTLTVYKLIEAVSIGSRSNRNTEIVVGNAQHLIDRRDKVRAQLEEVEANLAEVTKDIAYLEQRNVNMTAERQSMMEELQTHQPILARQAEGLKAKLEALDQDIGNVKASRIKAGAIYPYTKISMGHDSINIQDRTPNCLIYYHGDKIVIGNQ